MEKLKVLNRMTESGVVAVVRADSKEEAILLRMPVSKAEYQSLKLPLQSGMQRQS